jgi:hypothetical protein
MGSFDFATHRPVLAGQRSPGRSAFLERDGQQRVCNGLSLTPKTDSLPNVRFRGTPSAGAGQKRPVGRLVELPQSGRSLTGVASPQQGLRGKPRLTSGTRVAGHLSEPAAV